MTNMVLLVSQYIIMICVFSIIMAVVIDFLEFNERKEVKKKKKSIVATGSMFLFFFFFYFLLRSGNGVINLEFNTTRMPLLFVGLLLMVSGTIVNIRGRMDLGRNWSNQIKIYSDHIFIQKGMYRLVRHPLYASLIWMFFGASLVYLNYLAFLANLLIFVPFMYYRAKQEEELLLKEFPDYDGYRKKTWMFFPKIGIGGKNEKV